MGILLLRLAVYPYAARIGSKSSERRCRNHPSPPDIVKARHGASPQSKKERWHGIHAFDLLGLFPLRSDERGTEGRRLGCLWRVRRSAAEKRRNARRQSVAAGAGRHHGAAEGRQDGGTQWPLCRNTRAARWLLSHRCAGSGRRAVLGCALPRRESRGCGGAPSLGYGTALKFAWSQTETREPAPPRW